MSSEPRLFRFAYTMKETRREHLRRLIRDKFDGDRARFGKLVGIGKSRISQLMGDDPDQPFGELAASRLAEKLGLGAGFFERPLEPQTDGALKVDAVSTRPDTTDTKQNVSTSQLRGGLAHPAIRPAATVTPSHSWGEIVTAQLPDVFSLALFDDSMAPKAPTGTVVTFTTLRPARSGDAVLLRDKDGNHYFREYKERTPSHWQAAPYNPAYLSLDSIEDGLTVLAVFERMDLVVTGRWSEIG